MAPTSLVQTETTPLLPKVEKQKLSKTDLACILPCLFANIFLAALENTIIASIQNSIGASFNAGNNIAWVATSYLIVSTAVQPLYGRFAGLFGRTAVYVFALSIFSVGCICCGLSTSLTQMILARSFCGIGGAGLITISQIIAYDFIEIKWRGLYQAMTNSSYGLGGALGASMGGIITEKFGWRWCFYGQIPICLLSLFVFLIKGHSKLQKLGIEKKTNLKMSDIDILGSILLMSCITTILLGLNIGGNELPWSHPLIISSFVLTGIILALFFWHEKRCELPVLPLTLFHGKAMLSHLGANFFGACCMFSTFYLLPTYFQSVLLISVADASEKLAYPALAAPIGSIFTGLMLNGVSISLTGLLSNVGSLVLLLGSGMDLLLTFEDGNGKGEWFFLAHIIWTNLGQGILFPASLIDISNRNSQEQAITTSLIFLTRSLGSVFGISGSQSVLQNVLATTLESSISGPNKTAVSSTV